MNSEGDWEQLEHTTSKSDSSNCAYLGAHILAARRGQTNINQLYILPYKGNLYSKVIKDITKVDFLKKYCYCGL